MALKTENCLYFQTNSLSRILSGMADDVFRDVGLSPSHAFLLMTVNDEPGIQPSQLSELLRLSPSTITRLIEKMEYQGYLERASEGRATHVHPTDKCRDKDADLREAWEALKDRYTQKLGERYTEVLTEMAVKAKDQLESEN
ncbi:winged helix-turn-helix transcriptional regulator [Balneolaceae bacterium YR4-1]|uniref:Winged helix-turn-helix transcriptional regulator n=1 Tax=Halalkalibaculum roseum TaxID=2709311 RepID=A0A6M1SR56_9BACT|nr:MarR family winged helix-turn-helix transcriptional regulator [Halalkalibaculum roseum]NGP75212.1 winged helix-turn-helix transcriptional regulator [Halalkalibaculum roseum]